MDLAAHTKLGRAVQRGFTRRTPKQCLGERPLGEDDFISARNLDTPPERSNLVTTSDDRLAVPALPPKPKPSRHRFEKPIHNVKNTQSS
jgi:hypothetical protein